jgi:hypothetical protein
LKYDPKANINIRYSESNDTVKLTKRKIDDLIAMLEKGYALIPDSMSIRITGDVQAGGAFKSTQQVRDSFYFRKQKIEFIKKHDLVTPTKHFIPRERWNEL